MKGGNVPVIFGLKLRHLREERGLGLKELSELAGLSPSYVNEIEKGKKYPKADKIVQLAEALHVPFDEMVSLKLSRELHPLAGFLESPIVQALPLQMIGLTPRDVIDLVSRAPNEVSAFIHTLVEIAGNYDMRVEEFFYAMLRSYQETHDNYFEEIESAVREFVADQGWEPGARISLERLRNVVSVELGIRIEVLDGEAYPRLAGFRSVWAEGPPPTLLVNPQLGEHQQAFQLCREIGYRVLGLKARGLTSSRAEAASFEQVLNDFKASYFAGALLINQKSLVADLKVLFGRKRWSDKAFLALMQRYQVTPEMFLYRLTQLIPKHFKLRSLHFLRVQHRPDKDGFQVTKQFNLSGLLPLSQMSREEHYCRRWNPVSLLNGVTHGGAGKGADKKTHPAQPSISAQRARFMGTGNEYILITLARQLALTPGTNTSVTLGFEVERRFKATAEWWNDSAIPHVDVNSTCERCSLTADECDLRAAQPLLRERNQHEEERKAELQRLIDAWRGAAPG